MSLRWFYFTFVTKVINRGFLQQAWVRPALRTSGEAGPRLSRPWHRSPSRPGRDEAFSSPSSSITTQRPVGGPASTALDPRAGTRKPEDKKTEGVCQVKDTIRQRSNINNINTCKYKYI